MSKQLCNEFVDCQMSECPSYNNIDRDKCWTTPNTRCKDPITGDSRPKTIDEKLAHCFGDCKYHEYRKNLGR